MFYYISVKVMVLCTQNKAITHLVYLLSLTWSRLHNWKRKGTRHQIR